MSGGKAVEGTGFAVLDFRLFYIMDDCNGTCIKCPACKIILGGI